MSVFYDETVKLHLALHHNLTNLHHSANQAVIRYEPNYVAALL